MLDRESVYRKTHRLTHTFTVQSIIWKYQKGDKYDELSSLNFTL